MPFWEETLGQTEDKLERLYFSGLAWERMVSPWRSRWKCLGRDEGLDLPVQAFAPVTRTRINETKQRGHECSNMFNLFFFLTSSCFSLFVLYSLFVWIFLNVLFLAEEGGHLVSPLCKFS